MKTENQTLLLRDPATEPTAPVLENVLGGALYPVYTEFLGVTTNELGLEPQWRYYNDGKAWLCKVVQKKKTVCWLSIWDGFFKAGFYYTEKTAPGIFGLPISEAIKEEFRNAKPVGKLIPLILDIDHKNQLPDFRAIAEYKKNLK